MFGLEGLDQVGRVAGIIEKLITNSGLREKFEATGEVSGRVRLEEYEMDFTLRRRGDE